MVPEKLFREIKNNLHEVVNRKSDLGISLWEEFLKVHPADIASFLSELSEDHAKKLFIALPGSLSCQVFREFSEPMQAIALTCLDDMQRIDALSCLSADELTDLFESLSDEDLKKYLNLLHKNDREKVLALLQFNPDSAGGIMDTDVLPLIDDFTVHKSIQLLQRLELPHDLHRKMFVVDQEKRLVGYIFLEDLVLQKPQTRISTFMRPNELIAHAEEDQEAVAQKMVHYNLSIIPVVGRNNFFLGVITSSTLVDVIEEESAEDVYRMSAMAPVKGTYFDASFTRLLYQRGYILMALMLAQSLSSMIIASNEILLSTMAGGLLVRFITMLTSTGGNAGSQTSAVIIQGMASGEITRANLKRFFKREFSLAGLLALLLAVTAFVRAYITSGNALGSVTIACAVAAVVVVSMVIGSTIPVLLRRIHIDPAYAAGPVLATLMDILGLWIYCAVAQKIFTYFANFS